MKVAAIHFGKVSLGKDKLEQTLQENMERLVALNITAAEEGANLIVNPELPILPLYSGSAPVTPYSSRADDIAKHREVMQRFRQKWTEEITSRLKREVAAPHTYVVLSTFEYSLQHHNFYSSARVIGPGGGLHTYHKRQLTSDAFVMRGDSALDPVDLPFGKVGVIVCGDYSIPLISRALVLNGSGLIVIPTSVESKTENTLRARAIENGVPFVLANCYEYEREPHYYSKPQSAIVNAVGETEESYDGCENKILFAEFALGGVTERRRKESRQRHRRPLLYGGAFTDLTGMYRPKPVKPKTLVITISAAGFEEESVSEHVRSLIEAAQGEDAPVMVVLPELIVGRERLERQIQFSREQRYYLASGFVENNQRIISLFDPAKEEPIILYRKVHLSDDEEAAGMQPGDRLVYYLDLPMGRVGLLSGEDLLYPEAVEAHKNAGVDLILAPSCMNFDGEALFEDIAKARHMIVAVADRQHKGGIYQRHKGDNSEAPKINQDFINSLLLDTAGGRIEPAKGFPWIHLNGLDAITRD